MTQGRSRKLEKLLDGLERHREARERGESREGEGDEMRPPLRLPFLSNGNVKRHLWR